MPSGGVRGEKIKNRYGGRGKGNTICLVQLANNFSSTILNIATHTHWQPEHREARKLLQVPAAIYNNTKLKRGHRLKWVAGTEMYSASPRAEAFHPAYHLHAYAGRYHLVGLMHSTVSYWQIIFAGLLRDVLKLASELSPGKNKSSKRDQRLSLW